MYCSSFPHGWPSNEKRPAEGGPEPDTPKLSLPIPSIDASTRRPRNVFSPRPHAASQFITPRSAQAKPLRSPPPAPRPFTLCRLSAATLSHPPPAPPTPPTLPNVSSRRSRGPLLRRPPVVRPRTTTTTSPPSRSPPRSWRPI